MTAACNVGTYVLEYGPIDRIRFAKKRRRARRDEHFFPTVAWWRVWFS